MPSIEQLHLQYQDNSSRADRLRESFVEQIITLLKKNKVALGVPLESRVKDWTSIKDKLDRKSLEIERITDLDDLVGVRIILLFRKDLAPAEELLSRTFKILSKEDTSSRLSDAQFGYQSHHFVVAIPDSWATIPTFSDLNGLRAEIQVRTLAQHMWAAASHKLQYKHEDSVPLPLRRTIYRVSALLETVDLEFERVLEERQNYVEKDIPAITKDEKLNVDIVAATLDEIWPPANKSGDEAYADLLPDLFHFGINTVGELRDLLQRNLKEVLATDANDANSNLQHISNFPERVINRLKSGVFYTHIGLTREALRLDFGSDVVNNYMTEKSLTDNARLSLEHKSAELTSQKVGITQIKPVRKTKNT